MKASYISKEEYSTAFLMNRKISSRLIPLHHLRKAVSVSITMHPVSCFFFRSQNVSCCSSNVAKTPNNFILQDVNFSSKLPPNVFFSAVEKVFSPVLIRTTYAVFGHGSLIITSDNLLFF